MSIEATLDLAPRRVSAASSDEIDVVLGIDAKYAPHAAVVIASVVRHAPGARFRFIILHSGVDAALKARVEEAAPLARFAWCEITDADLPAWADREHFSRAILFRLGIEQHAPADCRRLIYLDADVIVTRDIRDMWRVDLGARPIGAVIDCFVDAAAFAKRWGLDDRAPRYFNSGVLLIDLDRVRAERLFSKAIDFVADHGAEIYLADQDALNFAIWDRWLRLDNVWNVQRHMVIPSLIESIPAERTLQGARPGIVHFTGPEKPWLPTGYHPWSWIYWQNAARTPFKAEIAQREGVGLMKRALLWLRWMRKRV